MVATDSTTSTFDAFDPTDPVFALHRGGKMQVAATVPLRDADDLSMSYTPGVARVCEAIAADPDLSHDYTWVSNTVAVITDGTAVLGLGDIGPAASMPEMEGTAVLFKQFGGVDAIPVALATTDVDEIVETIVRMAPTFGGVNLEDISSPRCFEIEQRLIERLAAEGEVCWGGMHSWKSMVSLLEAVDMPGTVGFQADLAHTYLYMLGVNSPKTAILKKGKGGKYSQKDFDKAYTKLTDALRPWTIDFHVAQNDGTVHGTSSHDKTGRHCPADDPNGKLDIPACSKRWLEGAAGRGIRHICWDGCMFPNALLEKQETWNTVLRAMISVKKAIA